MYVRRIHQLPEDICSLASEARAQGFRFLDRLILEFESGANRFEREGEALFAIFDAGYCVGIGGVNVDPISEASDIGRVRRVFVSSLVRGKGLGKLLMSEIEVWSHSKFTKLQLFTDTESASAFYEAIGYERVQENRVSHVRRLQCD